MAQSEGGEGGHKKGAKQDEIKADTRDFKSIIVPRLDPDGKQNEIHRLLPLLSPLARCTKSSRILPGAPLAKSMSEIGISPGG